MISLLEVYSGTAPELLLTESGIDTDFVQVTNIDGLDPVKAVLSTSPLGSVDGESFLGGHIPNRNIVLTLRPNPNWSTWTYETLRQLMYQYFIPKSIVQLIFHSDEVGTVEIFGNVESITANPFSKIPEFFVSILCMDPFFSAVEATELTGQSTIRPEDFATSNINMHVDGNVPNGFYVKVSYVSGDAPNLIYIQVGDPANSYFCVNANVQTWLYFEMDSVPLRRFVRNVDTGIGRIINMLSGIQGGSVWPFLEPGENQFAVMTDQGVQEWQIKYFERFGGL